MWGCDPRTVGPLNPCSEARKWKADEAWETNDDSAGRDIRARLVAGAYRRSGEGDGWVNWSGLATQLASIDKTFAEKMNRFFRDRLGLVLHGADHPSG